MSPPTHPSNDGMLGTPGCGDEGEGESRNGNFLTRYSSTLGYLGLTGVGNCGWLVVNQLWGVPVVELAVMGSLVTAPAWVACRSYEEESARTQKSALDVILDAVTGALAGWTTVELSISLPRTLRSSLLLALPATAGVAPMGCLALGAAATGGVVGVSFLFRKRVSPWFVLSWGWGVAGFALANTTTDVSHSAALGKAAWFGLASVMGYYAWMLGSREKED